MLRIAFLAVLLLVVQACAIVTTYPVPDPSQFKVRYLCRDVKSDPPRAQLERLRPHEGDMYSDDNAYVDTITVFKNRAQFVEYSATKSGKLTVKYYVNLGWKWQKVSYQEQWDLISMDLPGYLDGKSFKCGRVS